MADITIWNILDRIHFIYIVNGTLGSFRVPKIIALVYDSIGFMPTMILQLVFGLFLILIAFSKKEEKNNKEKE